MNIVIVDVEDDNLVVDLHDNCIIVNKSIKISGQSRHVFY